MAGLTKVTSGGITDGTITNADINASASIDASKVSGLSTDSIEVGNTKVFCTDTGDNGTVKINTEGSTRVTVDKDGFVTIPGNMSVAGMHLGLGTSDAHNSNTVLGNVAGENIASTGYYNICIGYEGGRGITTGDQNTMIGYRTGQNGTVTGHDNIGVGNEALQDLSSGYHNVCIGRETGQNLTTGYSNTFLGERAGYAGTVTGYSNVGIGVYAAGALTSGFENTCIGKNAGAGVTAGERNVCLGYNAGDEITTGDSNICIGNQSAGGLTTGNNNTIIGGSSSGFGSSTSDTVVLGIVGTERMRIDSNGKVGIGTTGNTTYNLQVAGSSSGNQFAIGDSSPRLILDYKSPSSSTVCPQITSDGEGLYYYGKNNTATSAHKFYAGSSNAEKARIDGDGLKFNGDTSSVNALDDYEEGTWTPSWINGASVTSYTTQSGRYTKIGRIVYFECVIHAAAGSVASSHLRMGGLPFNAGSGPPYGGAYIVYNSITAETTSGSDGSPPTVLIVNGTDDLYFYKRHGIFWNANDGVGTVIGKEVRLNGFYVAA